MVPLPSLNSVSSCFETCRYSHIETRSQQHPGAPEPSSFSNPVVVTIMLSPRFKLVALPPFMWVFWKP
ncbi:hypothetical protein V6N13_110487 [Hibiscus sabdariffa]